MKQIGKLLCLALTLSLWGGLVLAGGEFAPGTELRIRLRETLSSNENRRGDRFTATVLEPSRYEGAIVRGRIASIRKSGKITGQTRMLLKFEGISFPDGKSATLSADLIRVYESETENVKRAGDEGALESDKQSKEAVKRGAIGAAAGAILGGLAAGKKGAAIGLMVGGAGGAGSVAVTGKKELRLEQGTEMLIRTR